MKPFVRSFSVFLLLIVILVLFYKNQPNHNIFFPRLGDPTPSQENLQRILKKSSEKLSANPHNLKSLVDQGVAYFFMGPEHYADSLNTFNTAWKSGAFDKRIFYYSGILYEDLTLFEEAQKQYERFLKHEPNDREIRLRMARLLFRMGKWDDAIIQYENFIQKNSKDFTAILNLGLAYEKKYEKSAQENKLKPKNRQAQTGKSVSANEEPKNEADLNKAISYIEEALKIQPDVNDGIYLNLAKLYFEKGDWEKSVSAAQFELKKSTDSKETFKILTLAYEKLNQKEKTLETAILWFEKDPQNKFLRQKIKSLKSQLKKQN